jgi:hypothetical protein
MIDFSFEKSKNFLFNPILSFLRVYFQTNFLTSIQWSFCIFLYDIGLNVKFLRFSSEKSIIFLRYIYNI